MGALQRPGEVVTTYGHDNIDVVQEDNGAMAKKPSPLKNRLARQVTRRGVGVVAVALRPADERRSLFEFCWTVLNRVCPLESPMPTS